MPKKFVVPAITSFCKKDDKHILIWDFDGGKYIDIIKSLKEIQQHYNLGDILILQTKNGFNAICLDKFDILKAFEIKQNTEYADKNHNVIGFKFDKWCLRIGDDKELIHIMPGKNIKEKSFAHNLVLSTWLKIKLLNGRYDDNTIIEMESYPCYDHKPPKGYYA